MGKRSLVARPGPADGRRQGTGRSAHPGGGVRDGAAGRRRTRPSSAAWRQARDGVLLIPNVERFFGGSIASPEFPQGHACRAACLPRARCRWSSPPPPTPAGTTGWPTTPRVSQYSHRLRVPEPSRRRNQRHPGGPQGPPGARLRGADRRRARCPPRSSMAKRYVAGDAPAGLGAGRAAPGLRPAQAGRAVAGRLPARTCRPTRSWTTTTWPWRSAP